MAQCKECICCLSYLLVQMEMKIFIAETTVQSVLLNYDNLGKLFLHNAI